MKRTDGEWKFDPDSGVVTAFTPDMRRISVAYISASNDEAHGNGYAVAAVPKLLSALRKMRFMTQEGWITPEDRPRSALPKGNPDDHPPRPQDPKEKNRMKLAATFLVIALVFSQFTIHSLQKQLTETQNATKKLLEADDKLQQANRQLIGATEQVLADYFLLQRVCVK